MRDVIKDACMDVSRNNKTGFKNKFYAIRKVLLEKYRIDVSKVSLLNRVKEWKKAK
jgi:hypothetical protein